MVIVSRTRLRTPLELAIGATVAAAVVATTLHSGSVNRFIEPAGRVRPALYLLLLVLVSVYVAAMRPALGVRTLLALPLGLFVAVALVSPAWSVLPRRSLSQAAALAVVLVFAGVVAAVAGSAPSLARRSLAGAAAGAVALAAGGLVLYFVDRVAATFAFAGPEDQLYRGLGQNANTVPLLAALTLPLCAAAAAAGRRTSAVGGAVGAAALAATMVASQSRGAVAGAVLGLCAVAAVLPMPARRRIALVAGAAALLAATLFGAGLRAPVADAADPAATLVAAPVRAVRLPGRPAGAPPPLSAEVGAGRGSLLSSGRIDAWRGAIHQGQGRWALGYGFGTETPVFIDRYAEFQGAYVENTFVGMWLQLGAAGVLLLIAALASCVAGMARVRRLEPGEQRELGAAAAGAGVAAIVAAVVQSYLTAAGSVAALTAWLALLIPPMLDAPRVQLRVRTRTAAATVAALALTLGLAAVVGRAQARSDTNVQGEGLLAVYRESGPFGNARLTAFRLTWYADCFIYRSGPHRYALETCFDFQGRLIDAVDRRPPKTHFWSLRYDPDAAPLRLDERRIEALLERVGALDYAQLFLHGHPPHQALADTFPVEITSWLRLIGRRPPPAGPGSA